MTVILELALVAAQPLLKLVHGDFGGLVGVVGAVMGLKHHAGRQVQGAVDAKTDTLACDRDIGLAGAIEVFRDTVFDPFQDPGSQAIADIDALTYDLNVHALLPAGHTPACEASKTIPPPPGLRADPSRGL